MTSSAPFGVLTVSGGRLRGDDGRPVILRGMSLFWSQWGGRYYTKRTIDRLVGDWNINVVRAALAVEPEGYLAFPNIQMARICTVIDAAIKKNIYVIVDWHSHNPHTAAAVEVFSELGRRYGKYPNLIWEPWNEPGAEVDWPTEVVPHHHDVIDALRLAGAHGLVVCGTPRHCQDLDAPLITQVRRINVAYSLHFYAASHGAALRAAAERAVAGELCIFASEYGLGDASGDGPLALDEGTRWWRFLEARGISHVNWSLFDKPETCSALRRTNFFGRWVLSPSGRAVRSMLRSHRQAQDKPV